MRSYADKIDKEIAEELILKHKLKELIKLGIKEEDFLEDCGIYEDLLEANSIFEVCFTNESLLSKIRVEHGYNKNLYQVLRWRLDQVISVVVRVLEEIDGKEPMHFIANEKLIKGKTNG